MLQRTAWLLSLVGLMFFVGIVSYQGVQPVAAAVVTAGLGLVWVSLFHLLPLVIDTYAWHILLDKRHRIGFGRLINIAWIGEAVNSLLPVALIGGGLVRARLLSLTKVPTAVGGASVVVDLTVAVVSLIFFSLAGVVVVLTNAMPGHTSAQLLTGLIIFSFLIYAFYLAQRRGMFLLLARRLERMNGGAGTGTFTGNAAQLDRCVEEIYQRGGIFWFACMVRLVGWVIGTGEVWLALHFLGHPVTLIDALMLESLGQAIRSAAFVIPGALGIQEGAYLVLGASIGIPPQTGLALSLVKRVRELAFGLPGLLVWQWQEISRFRQRAGGKISVAVGGK